MRISLDCGLDRLDFEVAENNLISHSQNPQPLTDPAAAVRAALETPHDYPALRLALTPDDHVAIVLDEQLPRLVELLVPVLEHVRAAGVAAEAMTLLCPSSSSRQTWIDDLPDDFQDVRVEIAAPDDHSRLAYLAASSKGKPLYLNRTLVECDQVVVLSGRRYDPLLGYSGAEGALYPAFGDAETRRQTNHRIHLEPPGEEPWPARRAATEMAWLLGDPFFVQIIESAGDGVAQVIAGTTKASLEGQRLLDAAWRRTLPHPADLVVAGISGDPSHHTFAALASALACAARVVQPGGRIVLLTRAEPKLGRDAVLLRNEDDAQQLYQRLYAKPTLEGMLALQWTSAAGKAHINLLSALPDETVEDLFATPLHEAREVQRLLDAGGSCVFLSDAHKMLAVVE
jgi:nickel-dependent lactate racemase